MGYAHIRNVGLLFPITRVGIVIAALAALSLAQSAGAQTPPEAPKSAPTEKQSPVNPFPFPNGDAQNRGRASADYYWGVTDANTPAGLYLNGRPRVLNGKTYSGNALSRVPNAGARPNLLDLDGWGFPRGASLNGAFLSRPALRSPAINSDGQGTLVDATALNTLPNGNWVQVGAPSTLGSFPGATYLRTAARPRPNSTSITYITPAANKPRAAVWNLTNIADAGITAGQAVRYQVRVNLPTPGVGENRITDARYTVFYYLRVASGAIQARQKTFIVSQAAAGEGPLVNENGIPAFFPFYTNASNIANNTDFPVQPGIGRRFQGVVLDDTTGNDGSNLFVLADRLNLVGSIDSVYATPTVTRPHGGRRVDAVAAGTQPLQPFSGPNYVYDTVNKRYRSSDQKAHAYLSTAANAINVTDEWYNNLSTFINNPFDTNTIDTSDPDWTSNPSTLFRGPESLADPRLISSGQFVNYPLPDLIGDPVGPGTQNRVKVDIVDPVTGERPYGLQRTARATDANNHNIYRTDRLQAYNPTNPDSNPPVPYFSHQQVIMARTEYVLDPENGVPDNNKDGTLTIAVGSVWCLDSQTGAPIWRFPDRTYAPGSIRNPQLTDRITGALVFDSRGRPVYTIPGVVAIDKNLNGIIQDDEIFIAGQGNNPNGGLFASVSYVPKVPVRGLVQLPTYIRDGTGQTRINYSGATGRTIPAPPGRYYKQGSNQPVMVGVAYIAAANGVIYAVDAYGNNDNDYQPIVLNVLPGGYRNFGGYRPGTTNALWTFSGPLTLGRQNNETLPAYNLRLKREIPIPSSFGQSAPVIAYRKDEKDLATSPLDPAKDEPRLFIGNLNGYVYALDARADAGFTQNGNVYSGLYSLPFRKEQGRRERIIQNNLVSERNFTGVKWWFAARGGINATPAVSVMRQNAGKVQGSSESDLITKGVYVTSQEGRVYCIDWDGPVTRQLHSTAVNTENIDYVNPLTFSNPPALNANYGASPFAARAEKLNDDYRFHNLTPTINGRADRTQGNIRPRWTYPNLYRQIRDGDALTFDRPIDKAYRNTLLDGAKDRGIADKSLVEPGSSIGAITTAPVLMDFPFQKVASDPTTRELRSYLVFQAHDSTQDGTPPTESRVYLLDQVGDRANFLSNPVVRKFGSVERISAYPRDRFSPKQVLGDSSPAWSYRYVYDTYTGTNFALDMSRRNSPIVPPILSKTDSNYTANPNQGVPSRRLTPTVYIGGVGKVFGIDIDPQTGLFMRWRPSYAATSALTSLPEGGVNQLGFDITDSGNFFYKPEATRDLLDPLDPSLRVGYDPVGAEQNFARLRILARVTPLYGSPSSVNSVVISGGPMQNRSVSVSATLPQPSQPMAPLFPTNDAPNWRPLFFDLADLVSASPKSFDFSDPFNIDSPTTQRGLTHFIAQDINDPLTTTEGALATDTGNADTSAVNRIPNLAYQYPMLFVTDAEGNLHAASSNIEGEDRSVVNDANFNRSFTVGWPLFGVTENIENQFQQGHTLHFSQFGPGGPGGVAVVTNTYYPSLDPNYVNSARATADPTGAYRNYPYGEPNTTSPTPYRSADGAPTTVEPIANNDDPRTDFRPRSLSPLNSLTNAADTNTGQTGFPLDLNGLFFDRRFAGKGGVVLPNNAQDTHPANETQSSLITQNPNGAYTVKLRVPGYSYIGGLLTAADFPNGVNPNDQVPDGARRNARFVNNVRQVDNIADDNDDINPAGQNVAWIYSGGVGGLLYAFTPAIAGQTSGGAAGTPNVATNPNDRTFGLPTSKVAIVDPTTFASIRNSVLTGQDPRTLALNGSIARKGGKNFYEWGETVYVVVYDLLGNTVPRNEDDYYVIGGGQVQLQFVNALQNTRSGGTQQALVTRGDGAVATYTAENVKDPEATRLGVVLFKLTLGDNSSQFPQTPGDVIQVTATQSGVRRPGQLVNIVQSPQTTLENADGFFSIANPIAVQGFLTSTTGATVGPASTQAGDVNNGIGPFEAAADQYTAGAAKSRISFGQTANDGSTDPQKQDYRYAAALTNGNRVRRRDLRRFLVSGSNIRLNPSFSSILKDSNGGDDPEFYFPVMTNAGYVNHGDTGTTDVSSGTAGVTVQNLRIMNRSLLPSLKNVRVIPASAMVWRYWPGRVPNAEADTPANALDPAVNNNNPRFTPAGMDIGGRINPLPWETGINEAKPWNPTAPGNSSPDYPDIPASTAIKVSAASGNLTVAPGSLAADVNTTDAEANWRNGSAVAAQNPTVALPGIYATAAAVTVPKYQPANLVATHSLTSSYVAPTVDDNAITDSNPAPLQLPRGINNRNLQRYTSASSGSATYGGSRDIVPYGYSSRMLVTVGNNINSTVNALSFQQAATGIDPLNRLTLVSGASAAPYREFEIGVGVPVDASMKVAEETIDLGSFGHSFGIQNGLLGYGAGDPAFATGLLPAPLFNTGLFPNNQTAPYNSFFKKFTVQNTGNVNLWNLRSAQRLESPASVATAGSGFPFRYLGLLSETVDPSFGILAVGTDPNKDINNLMPQIITSLDKRYDAAWDQYLQTGPANFSQPFIAPLEDGTTPYQRYYAAFKGRHTLHKPVVGVNAPAVGSIPDLPSAQYLRPLGDPQPQGVNTVVSVATPLGTPSGTYSSTAYGQRFVVFEDHDTNSPYLPVPTITTSSLNSLTLSPAGPLYGGSNVVHPGKNSILTRGNGSNGEGIWRYRYNAAGQYEPLPASDPGINLKITVGETPLTGDVADRGLENSNAKIPLNVAAGRLPAVDAKPLIDATGQARRSAAALSPAGYRTPDGKMHLFFSRNYQGDPSVRFAQPGQPYRLFKSTLNWDRTLGTFAASNIGAPVDDATKNAGKWFADATPETMKRLNPGTATESNVSPFVLQPFSYDNNGKPVYSSGATLFWVNSQPQTAGGTYNQIMFSALDASGNPTGNGQSFLSNYDPAVQRFSPRAIQTNGGSVIVTYYGGSSGRWGLYYSVRNGDANGTPVGNVPNATAVGQPIREVPLTLPASIASASDPAPIFRGSIFLPSATNPAAVPQSVQAVDIYFSGVLKTTQTPEAFVGRYRITGGGNVRLTPMAFPRITGEKLIAAGRGASYAAKNISWNRTLTPDSAGNYDQLPVIYIGGNAVTLPNPTTNATRANNAWNYDAATGVLYQTFRRGVQQGIVYVDTDSGAVRFRGDAAPTNAEPVYADYTPQVLRLSDGKGSGTGVFALWDNRLLAPTFTTANQARNTVLRRFYPDTPANAYLPAGRSWLFYQKGATTLQYAVRRVGIDLKSVLVAQGGMVPGDTESIALGDRSARGNQLPAVDYVQIRGNLNQFVNRFEVDYASGRIYIDPQYEGLPLQISYYAYNKKTNTKTQRTIGLNGTIYARQIDELGTDSGGAQQVPMQRSVNETQPYAFLDLADFISGVSRPSDINQPAPGGDPTLQPGRVWLLWTSPRGRQGVQPNATDLFPTAYDLYWQTLAPNFDPKSLSPLPPL